MSLNNIYNQEIVQSTLINGLKYNKLSQSLLFYGDSYSGKMHTAVSLAKALNCPNGDGLDFCDSCNNCKRIDRFSFPDVFVIDSDDYLSKFDTLIKLTPLIDHSIIKGHILITFSRFYSRLTAEYFSLKKTYKGKKVSKSKFLETLDEYQKLLLTCNNNKDLLKLYDKKVGKLNFIENIEYIENCLNLNNIPIQTVKDLMEKMNLSLTEGKRKVFIFNGIELMKSEGSNAFLKSIEEPPKNTQIILITNNYRNILQTIKSRCYTIKFNSRSLKDLIHIYSDVFQTDLGQIDATELNTIFENNPEILYKKNLISVINVLSQLCGSSKSFTKLSMITDFSKSLSDKYKNKGKHGLKILKQVFTDILLFFINMKYEYNFSMFVKNNNLMFSDGELKLLDRKINTIKEFMTGWSMNKYNNLLSKTEENFSYIFYNNVEIDMSISDLLTYFQ